MIVLFESFFKFLEPIALSHADLGHELMRFRNLVERFQISSAIRECECLSAARRSYGFNGGVRSMQLQTIRKPQSEARRHTIFKNLKLDDAGSQVDPANILTMIVRMFGAV